MPVHHTRSSIDREREFLASLAKRHAARTGLSLALATRHIQQISISARRAVNEPRNELLLMRKQADALARWGRWRRA